MKRLSLLILFAVLLALPALSQQISVESFTPLENDLTANTAGTMKKDQNGKTCALIKVVTSEKGFNFDVGILGVVATEQKVGEIWVYVPEKIRFITIAHPQLGVLRNYPIPQQVESARTYELRLVTGKVHTVIEEAQTDQFVVFHISPADAILEFDGQPLLLDAEGSASCFKPFGKYQYRIERKDYHTEVGSVTVTAEKASVNVNMRPMFGWLEVNSANAGSDARVFVDGSDHGTLPLHTLQLGSGKHLLKIIKPLYHIFQQSVTIADNDTLRVNAALKSDFRNYTITGDADADIYINQEYKGHGSWSGPLASGTYRIELRKPSHRTTIRSITINADDLSANDIISLPAPTPIYGSLKVTSSPMDAIVAIDGKVMGKTPLFIKEVLIGSHSVTLSKDGYKTETATTDINERKTSELNIVLNNAIRVKFTSNATSVVNIDGKYIGLTPCDALLTCTKHEISMSADRYQSRTETIDISEGSSLISWQLKPNFKKVTISCNQNANFYIDGKIAGSGYSISRDIDYGEHSISAYYEGKSKETTITVAEGNESSVDFSFRKKRYHENYVSNDAFYMGAIYQCLNFQGAGAIMGFFAGKFNMEVSFIAGNESKEVDWYTSTNSLAHTSDFKNWRINGRIGWGLRCDNVVRITPQIGAAVLALQDRSKIDDETAPSACSFTGSVQFALVYKKLCLTITPEYYVPVAKSDGMKELVKVSDAYDKALKGFDLQVGISLIF